MSGSAVSQRLRTGQPVVTAQLRVSDSEAYVATCEKRNSPGPNGEVYQASVWHTDHAGASWSRLPWARSLRTFVSPGALAPWPPECVTSMALRDGALRVEFWEDWGMDGRPGEDFETGYRTEPIWHATLAKNNRWSLRVDRHWRSADGAFGPHPVELNLPGFLPPPGLG
jgi:hypothetical protein